MVRKTGYISTNRSKQYLKCHLILVTKYRRNILVGQLDNDLKSIFSSIADNSDFEFEIFELDVNHIHFLIRYIPRLSVSQLVRSLKQESMRQLWLLHSNILHRYYWNKKIVWSDGFFVCSIGEACPDTIKHYILSQG